MFVIAGGALQCMACPHQPPQPPNPLREPKLIVCDEATSALDTATEKSIMGSLRELAAGRTSVFVAHRLSTVQACGEHPQGEREHWIMNLTVAFVPLGVSLAR